MQGRTGGRPTGWFSSRGACGFGASNHASRGGRGTGDGDGGRCSVLKAQCCPFPVPRSPSPDHDRTLEKSAEAPRFRGETVYLACRERRVRLERHLDTILRERAAPDTDQLTVDDNDMRDE